ncbi:MAG: hypothetical protein HOI42_13910, partial [Candidatus Marinimicrobia bacterium]|nr:hypothetical protein [Candidatus Neomarinimicrobiota bacterium]
AMMVGMPIYVTDTGTNDLVNTGGNYMSDGLGNAFASNLILEENEPGNPYNVSAKTEEEIEDMQTALLHRGVDGLFFEFERWVKENYNVTQKDKKI